MKSLKNILFTFGIFALIIVGLVLLSNGSRTEKATGGAALSAGQEVYDFGAISMAKGPVKTTFTVENSTAEPLELSKLYTSCMCTTATLTLSGQTFGPFGMPGHGVVPPVNQTLASGEEAAMEVVFDPAAHGPAGVGTIERTITLETSRGQRQFTIKAKVTP